MKKISKMLALVCLAGLLAAGMVGQQAQGAAITGAISFAGAATLNSTSVNTATAMNSAAGVVASRDGSFAAFTTPFVTGVAFTTPWSFNSGPIANFWTAGGFTFDLIGSAVVTQSGGSLFVVGSGIIKGNGFDPTAASWSFTSQDPSAGGPTTFSFSASGNAVPDGGSTVALLGMALVGVGAVRRKLGKA